TVNYQEKTYAAGRIPGGFFKREGRPTEKETLTSRLIDRPIRPLFPEGFINDVQVVASVLSVNSEVDPDIASLLGASAALAVSGMPFMGPIGAARVGYLDGKYILNPPATHLAESNLVFGAPPPKKGWGGSKPKPTAGMKKSCSVPSCSVTNRCSRRSKRSTNSRRKPASRNG